MTQRDTRPAPLPLSPLDALASQPAALSTNAAKANDTGACAPDPHDGAVNTTTAPGMVLDAAMEGLNGVVQPVIDDTQIPSADNEACVRSMPSVDMIDMGPHSNPAYVLPEMSEGLALKTPAASAEDFFNVKYIAQMDMESLGVRKQRIGTKAAFYLALEGWHLRVFKGKGGPLKYEVSVRDSLVSVDVDECEMVVPIEGKERPLRLSLESSGLAQKWSHALKAAVHSDIEEHYQLGKSIGRGAYGNVVEAYDARSQERRAIKIIQRGANIKSREHLKREIQIMMRDISHPGIVRTYQIFDLKRTIYIVMEHVSGGDLFDFIAEQETLTEGQAVDVFRSILEAVDYLHRQHIVHRDLKPENILCVERRWPLRIKLTDFGFASFIDPETYADDMMKTPVGTPYFMAPEIITNQGHGPAVDSFACGVILYTMLTGRLPFPGHNTTEYFKNVVQGKARFPANLWRGISPDAQSLVRGLLNTDPRKRYDCFAALQHRWIWDAEKENEIPRDRSNLHSRKRKLQKARAAVYAIEMALRIKALHQAHYGLDKLPEVIEQVGDGTKKLAKGVGEGVKKTADGIETGVKKTVDGIETGVKKTVDGIETGVKKTVDGIETGVKKTVDGIETGVKKTVDGIETGVKKTVDGIETGVKKTVDGIEVGMKKTGEGLKKTADGIGDIVEKTVDGVETGVKKTGEGIKKTADGIETGVKKTADGIGTGLKKTGEGVKKTADGLGTGLKKTAEGFGDVMEKTGGGVKKTADGIGTGIKKTADGLGDIVEKTVDGIETGVKRTSVTVRKGAEALNPLHSRTSSSDQGSGGAPRPSRRRTRRRRPRRNSSVSSSSADSRSTNAKQSSLGANSVVRSSHRDDQESLGTSRASSSMFGDERTAENASRHTSNVEDNEARDAPIDTPSGAAPMDVDYAVNSQPSDGTTGLNPVDEAAPMEKKQSSEYFSAEEDHLTGGPGWQRSAQETRPEPGRATEAADTDPAHNDAESMVTMSSVTRGEASDSSPGNQVGPAETDLARSDLAMPSGGEGTVPVEPSWTKSPAVALSTVHSTDSATGSAFSGTELSAIHGLPAAAADSVLPARVPTKRSGGGKPVLPEIKGLPLGLLGDMEPNNSLDKLAHANLSNLGSGGSSNPDALRKAATLLLHGSGSTQALGSGSSVRGTPETLSSVTREQC